MAEDSPNLGVTSRPRAPSSGRQWPLNCVQSVFGHHNFSEHRGGFPARRALSWPVPQRLRFNSRSGYGRVAGSCLWGVREAAKQAARSHRCFSPLPSSFSAVSAIMLRRLSFQQESQSQRFRPQRSRKRFPSESLASLLFIKQSPECSAWRHTGRCAQKTHLNARNHCPQDKTTRWLALQVQTESQRPPVLMDVGGLFVQHLSLEEEPLPPQPQGRHRPRARPESCL